ncbi:MAG: PAS domain S-box protein [Verrucomicrobiales bacterium]
MTPPSVSVAASTRGVDLPRDFGASAGEAFSEQVVNSLPGVFFLFDESGRFLRWNRNFEIVAGKSAEELSRRHLLDFIRSEDRERMVRAVRGVFGEREADLEIEAGFVAENGVATPYLFTGRKIEFDGRACLIGTGIDISRRKAAETARDRLFNLSSDLLCIIGFDGYFKQLNPAWERTLGWRKEVLLGRPYIEFVHPEDRQDTRNETAGITEGVSSPVFENRYRCRDGSWKWLAWNTVSVPEHRLIYAVVRDVTAEKEVARALHESEDRFRAFMHENPAVAWMKDKSGRYVYVNETFTDTYEIREDQILGRTDAEFLPAHVAHQLRANDDAVIAAQVPLEFVETIPLPDGRERLWRVWKFPFRNLAGISHVGGFALDVTGPMQAEEAVRHSEERYRSLVEGARDSIFTISPEGVVTSLNLAFEEITGWAREHWIGKAFPGIVEADDLPKAMEYFKQVLGGENPASFELDLVAPEGSSVPMELTVTPQYRDGDVVGVLGIGRDIRERRQLEGELRRIQKLDSIGRLAAGIAHDYNNILSVQQGCVSLLLMEEDLPPIVTEMLQPIADATDRAAALTRQLLLFSRKQVMEFRQLNVNDVVTNLGKMLERILGADVSLRLSCSDALPPVHADPGMIEQAVMNLAVNARDAMPSGGALEIATELITIGEAEAHATHEARPGEFVRLRVTDTGGGMSPEIRDQIFEPFFTTKEVGKGTGLGLSNVHGIAKQHRGWVEFDSEPGAGSCFRIFLPVAAPGDHGSFEADVEAEVRGGNETILVAEDEKPLLLMIQTALERHGYRVLTAETGAEALQAWQDHPGRVDLVLTDLVMPGGMTGMELARRLRGEDPDLRIVFMSGYSADLAGKELSLAAGTTFLQKPFALEKLARSLRACLDQ